MTDQTNALRRLPSVGKLLATADVKQLVERYGSRRVVAEIRAEIEHHRQRLRSAVAPEEPPTVPQFTQWLRQRLRLREESTVLRPVINATGILLHTGLGRAPLATQAVEAIAEIARGYASVELDLAAGERGQRMRSVEDLLCELCGAEAALVVNNNAAATMLALAALAKDGEVVVSRGELIEIGGQFRLPEIMAASGAVLREVGTTNKTRLSDYAKAIGDRTAALLLVHPSNYAVVGFAQQVPLADLVALGRRCELPVIHDIGSGALVDFAQFGFRDEPLASRSLDQGADVVLFSGDKLLGGPQCGVILGRRGLVDSLAQHPMARAMRVDKLTLAGLAATLKLYRDPEGAMMNIPLLRLLNTPVDELRGRANAIALATQSVREVQHVEVVDDQSFLGGGSVPAQQQATVCVAITPRTIGLDRFARALRTSDPAIVGRIRQDRLLLDLRTVFPEQDAQVVEAVRGLEP